MAASVPLWLAGAAVIAVVGLADSAWGAYQYPWQDPALDVPARVANLISLLTLEEKVSLLNAASPAIDRINLPQYAWANECERGDTGGPTGTSFPSGIALGTSWNASLVYAVAHATAIERRANMDVHGTGGASCFGPVVNLIRDPRWGRTNEMIGGEDTTLGAVLGVAFVRGIQSGTSNTYRLVNTIAKHLSAYSGPEGYCGGVTFATQTRFSFTARMDERTWREFFLPPWRAMAVDGRVTGFMSSYSAVALTDGKHATPANASGVPDTASTFLLSDTIRTAWNWDGYILSDAGAVAFLGTVDWQGTNIGHQVAANNSDAAARALSAGVDLELVCCNLPSVFPTLVASVRNGTIPETLIQRALMRTLPYRFELGTLDPPGYCPYTNFTAANVSSPWMIELASSAGRQAVVLLKNSDDVLPLSVPSLAGRTIAVLGPSANDSQAQQGGYTNGHPPFIRTPLQGLIDALPLSSVLYDSGCNTMACSSFNSSALTLTATADVVIIVLGTTVNEAIPAYACAPDQNAIEAEGWDRANVSLPGLQLEFLQAVAAQAQRKPVVLVVVNAGMLDLTWAHSSRAISAIVHAPFLGMVAGEAIAAVLTGEANPAGRLTHTWYTAAGITSIGDITDYRMRADPANSYPGRTYRYTTAPVQYPFGFGLSYSTFAYSGLRVSPSSPQPCDNITVTVQVKNTSPIDGSEVVQLYLSMPQASVPTPIRSLAAFARVWIPAGTTIAVQLTISPRLDSIMRGGDYVDVVEPGPRTLWVGASSDPSAAPGVASSFTVGGRVTPLAQCENTNSTG